MYGYRYGYRGRQRGVGGWGAVEPLFALSEQGLWLDISDHSTLYQDIDGFLPATAAGQTVALVRDKSGRGNHLVQPIALSRPTLQTDGLGHWWLYFDGVDDFMVSATALNLSASSKLSVFAGFHSDMATGSALLAELSANGTAVNGTFFLSAPLISVGVQYGAGLAVRGTPGAFPGLSTVPPFSGAAVTTHQADTSAYIRSRRLGNQVSNVAFSQGGNFAPNQKLYLGSRAGTSAFYRGRLYQLVIRAAETTDAHVRAVEAEIARKMGITL